MINRFKQGFTLIELLVVIAIIGILSSVILSQLNNSRNRGNDASIKATMNSAASAAQLYYDIHNNSNWNGVCTADNGLNKIMVRLGELSTASACSGVNPTGWRIHALLKSSPVYWCADHLGVKKACNNVPTGQTCAAAC